ncbi:MAG: gamma-glutamyltransferase [Burkholderiales bacterium]|nr:gamma-glutamyltransferase [Burkholderiales bacterium]
MSQTAQRRARFGFAALLWAALSLPLQAQTDRPAQPEPPTGRSDKTLAHAQRHMVAAAHPLAVEAGLKILDAGGSAVDAMITVQLVLNLVEPHASGLGGGAFLMHYNAGHREIQAYDGRETAPAAATAELFMRDGKAMQFREAVAGGRAVGTPGVARLLEQAHRKHGRLPWALLFEPAIALAEKGYPMSRRVHALLLREEALAGEAAAREHFLNADGTPKAAGTIMRNREFAETLRALQSGGADAFYRGAIARDLVAAVRGHARNPGVLDLKDLDDYQVREVDPLCAPYREYRVCGMPPSSSGGIAVLQMLGMLSHHDLSALAPGSVQAVHLLAEAGRLAYADRDRWVADDRFVEVPVAGLLDPGYLASRARLISNERSMVKAEAGTPPGARLVHADDTLEEVTGTSHVAIIDAAGNAVSLTTTIENFFGSRLMVRGFLLNNQLTDFNFNPQQDGRTVANAVAPGKRPRSSMAPTLVFRKNGDLHLVVGSPGGSRIINYVAKTLIATLDWNMDIQSAIALPNAGSRNGPTEIERDTAYAALAEPLQAMGHEVQLVDMTSGLHGIMRAGRGWQGGADPRREGIAKGR